MSASALARKVSEVSVPSSRKRTRQRRSPLSRVYSRGVLMSLPPMLGDERAQGRLDHGRARRALLLGNLAGLAPQVVLDADGAVWVVGRGALGTGTRCSMERADPSHGSWIHCRSKDTRPPLPRQA